MLLNLYDVSFLFSSLLIYLSTLLAMDVFQSVPLSAETQAVMLLSPRWGPDRSQPVFD
ncbi:MAG: hypothetical protein KatS3mg067_0345 [Thermosynechococcus sp.]|nr:MAG: hypothetical protein KatS3mg067_0345 [Thermosynechococcus sp.]